MKNNTVLYILLVFLIVVNGFFLYNYMGNDSDNNPKIPQRNRGFIEKELEFNATQLEQFKEESKEHDETLKQLSNEIKELKDNLFGRLSDVSLNEETIDSISNLIGKKETEKEKEIFYHFKMIQEIADDKQKEKFQRILMNALRRGEEGHRPPPGEGHRPPPREGGPPKH